MANKFRLSVQNVDMGGSNDSSDEEITGIEPYGLERGRDYENLCHLLRICAIKHVDGTIGRFWPRAILDRIMTRDRIFQELSTYQSQSLTNGAEEQKHNVHQLADIIHAQYRVIFAILNLLMKGYCIQDFIREQLKDDDLPLIKQKRSWASVLQRRLSNGYVPSDCRATEKWHPHERDIFADLQYQLSPVFLDMEPNGRDIKDLRLDSCAVLPFMEKDHRGQGGYGLVNRVKIHPECHAFRDILSSIKTDDFFALKEPIRVGESPSLRIELEREFRRILDSLKRFNGFHHPHLVTLLMTWTLNNCHYLLFPMATSNVEVYWEDHPKPIMDLGTVQWISKQVLGMTSAIDSVHNPPSDTLLPPENQLYGRHGDLKPENILHYSSPKDERGIWIIADLGLTALNSVFSRSNLSNGKVQCSPRYKPPECDLIGGKISRSYDIWTFGCVLLEMIIWALEGDEERRRFLRHLDKPYLTGSRSDKFFDIMIKATGGHVVLVKNEVYEWIARLHHSSYCTGYFHDLLDLIEDHMIVTLAKNRDRINSKRLKTKVGEMHAKVMAPSSDYATKPQCYGGQKRSHEPVDAEFKWSSQNTIDKNNLDTYTGKSLRTKSDQELSKIE